MYRCFVHEIYNEKSKRIDADGLECKGERKLEKNNGKSIFPTSFSEVGSSRVVGAMLFYI